MTAISIGSYVVSNWELGGSTAKLRIFCDRNFLTSDLKSIQAGSPENDNFFQEVTVTIAGTNATISAFSLDSTTDARAGFGARYSFYFYDSNNVKLTSFGGFESVEIPNIPSSTTLDAIRIFNATPVSRPPDLSTFSRIEILALFEQRLPSGLLPTSTGGTGANLSATGPGLLKQAGVGSNVTVSVINAADLATALTLRERDLSPSFNFTTLEFDQATGFAVTNPSAGVGRVALSSIPITSTTGTLQPSRGGTGAIAVPTDGQLLIGNTAMGIFAVASLGVGTSLVATPGAGSLSLNAIQDIRTSATPTFAGINTTARDAVMINPFGASAGNTGEQRFLELAANGVNYTGWKAPDSINFAGGGNLIYILPSDDPVNGDMLTAGTPSGGFCALSWTTPAGAGTGYATIQEEGVSLTQFATLNFIGAALTAADGTGKTNVTLLQSPVGSTSVVGTGRQILNGTGITGGGDLTSDRTLSVVPNTVVERINGRLFGGSDVTAASAGRPRIEFEGTGGAVFTITDDAANDAIKISLNAGSGGSGIAGSGTMNRHAKFTASATLGDSLISDDGTNISVQPVTSLATPIRFLANNGTSFAAIKSPATLVSNLTFVLPNVLTTTTATNRYLQTDASGNLSFAAAVGSLALDALGTTVQLVATGNDYVLSIPAASATAEGKITTGAQTIAGAKIFTSDFKISKSAPMLILEDTSALKHLAIQSVGNGYDFRDINDPSGSLVFLDLTNNRVGVVNNNPATALDIGGVLTLRGATSGAVALKAPATLGTATYTLPAVSAVGYLKSDINGVLSIVNAYGTVQGNGSPATQRDTINFIDGTNSTATVTDVGGVTTVKYDVSGGAGSGTVTTLTSLDASATQGAPFTITNPTTTPDISLTPNSQPSTVNANLSDKNGYLMMPAGLLEIATSITTASFLNDAGATVTNTIFVAKVFVPNKIKFTKMAFGYTVTTVTLFSAAIYSADGQQRLAYTGVTTANVNGPVIVSALTPSTVTLQPGWYLWAWTTNSTNAFTVANFTTTGKIGALINAGNQAGNVSAGNSSIVAIGAATTGGALPTTIGSVTGYTGGFSIPLLIGKLYN